MQGLETEGTPPININISSANNTKTNEQSQNQEKYSEFSEYIIKNNIALQEEVKSKTVTIKELEAKVQEHEQEEDKYDTRLRYMKGLLQNLNELKGLYLQIKISSDMKTEIIREHNKTTKKLYYEIYAFLVIINLLTLITPFTLEYFNMFNLLLQTMYFTLVPYGVYKIKDKYTKILTVSKDATQRMREQTAEINKFKEDIKKIEEASMSLDNWICEL